MECSLFGVMTKFHSFGFLFPLLFFIPPTFLVIPLKPMLYLETTDKPINNMSQLCNVSQNNYSSIYFYHAGNGHFLVKHSS